MDSSQQQGSKKQKWIAKRHQIGRRRRLGKIDLKAGQLVGSKDLTFEPLGRFGFRKVWVNRITRGIKMHIFLYLEKKNFLVNPQLGPPFSRQTALQGKMAFWH